MAREFKGKYDEVPQGVGESTPQSPSEESGGEDETSSGRRWILYGGIALLAFCGVIVATSVWDSRSRSRHAVDSAGFLVTETGTLDSYADSEDELEEITSFADAAKVISADWRARPGEETALKTGEALPKDRLMTLYHQTSPEACEGILHSDFRLGTGGWCGKGIYFAMSPEDTRRKAVTTGSGHGCMLEVVVDVGTIQRFNACGKYNGMTLSKLHKFGADSILFEPPESTGDEVIIFEPKRVKKKTIIPFKEEWLAKTWHGKPR